MQFVGFMACRAIELLAIALGFWVFWWILGDGRKTIKNVLKALPSIIQDGCIVLKAKLAQKKMESAPVIDISDIPEDSFDPKCTLMTYEEWEERMKSGTMKLN